MKKIWSTLLAGAILAALASCATTYGRNWQYESSEIADNLIISGDTFRLERTSAEGTAVFEGAYKDQEKEWIFDVLSYASPKGQVRRYNPAVRYTYSVKKFANGVSFLGFDVEGRLGVNFIQRGDFALK